MLRLSPPERRDQERSREAATAWSWRTPRARSTFVERLPWLRMAVAHGWPQSRCGPLVILRGRRREPAVFDGLLEGVRSGRSGVLVVWGEAGVGKTALLESALTSVGDLRVLRVVGVESEMELAFAGLHQSAHRCWIGWRGFHLRSVRRSRSFSG